MENIKKERLSTSLKVGYGVGTLGESLAYNTFYLYFIFFLTDFVGMNPAIAGTISLIAVLWDAITNPIVGILSDRSKNPKGRRRPFIAKFCIPLGVITFLIFTSWEGMSETMQIVYFLGVNILFWLAFALTDIPYITLGGEIANTSEDRLSIRNYATIFFYIGFIIASSGTILILGKLSEMNGGNSISAWSTIGGVYGAIVILTFLISVRATKGKEPVGREEVVTNENKVGIFKSIREIFKIKPYRNVWLYSFFFNLGAIFATSSMIYLMLYFVGATEAQTATVYFAYSVMVIIVSPIVAQIAKKIGNKKALVIILSLAAAGYMVFQILPLNMNTIYIIAFLAALGNGGFFVISYAMVYDISEFAKLKTGIKNEGIMLAFYQFSLKFATAVAMWLVGVSLTAFKYDPSLLELSDFTMSGLKSMGTLMPGLFMAVAIPFLLRYTLNSQNIEKLKAFEEDKKAGKEVDENELKKIL